MAVEAAAEGTVERGVAGAGCLREPAPHGWRALDGATGSLPGWLDGRLYRVGPGRFEADGAAFSHWFDGEGLVLAIEIRKGGARAACNFVAPSGAGDRGRFGAAPRGFFNRLRSIWDPAAYVNVANTSLLMWRGRMYALFEAGLPTEIDPETLATIGETDLEGTVRRAFSAHPKYHARSGDWINQGFRLTPRPCMDYIRLRANGGAEHLCAAPTNNSSFTHDFALTDRHIVTICPPVFARAADMLLRGLPLSQALHWRADRATRWIATPLEPPHRPAILETPALFWSHTAQAYEDGDHLVVQGVAAPDASGMDWLAGVRRGAEALPPASPGRLTEARIDLGNRAITHRPLLDASLDFPAVSPTRLGGRARYVYAAAYRDEAAAYRDLFDALVKIDLEGGAMRKAEFGSGVFVSEPVIAPRRGRARRGRRRAPQRAL